MSGNVPSSWMTNVMGILGDGRVLCASILCPALSYYAASELFENPPAGVVESFIGGYCLCAGFCLRTRLREKYNLDGSLVGDFLAHLCCHCVALARVWREAEVQVEAGKQQIGGPNMIPPNPQYVIHGHMHQTHMQPGIQSMPYYGPMPPQIFMGQQGIVVRQAHYRPDTIDTNLSDFDSRVDGPLDDSISYNRHDSIDPPPSNTDPDPWDMLRTSPSQEDNRPKPIPESRPDRPGVPYETFVSGEMADIAAAENQPSPFSRKEMGQGEVGRQLSARLANLRPSPPSKPSIQVRKGSSEEADRIIMGSTQLVSTITMVKEETEETHESGHDDPPQPTRSGSLPSKPDDASLLTYVATVGSEALPRYINHRTN